MPAALKSMITGLVAGIGPTDDLGREHRRKALSWLAGTDDIFRRVRPRTPSPHLVSYFLLVDRSAGSVLLCDHRLSGLWLPPGGHVEPGEHPLGTVRREAAEELGVTAQLDATSGDKPFFLTMTETVGPPAMRHVDVSLWFALTGRVGQPLHPDQREFALVRWWTVAELCRADPDRFEPRLLRALDALGLEPGPAGESSALGIAVEGEDALASRALSWRAQALLANPALRAAPMTRLRTAYTHLQPVRRRRAAAGRVIGGRPAVGRSVRRSLPCCRAPGFRVRRLGVHAARRRHVAERGRRLEALVMGRIAVA